MPTLLLKNADVLVTMDAARREIPGGGVFIRDNIIETVGTAHELPQAADEVIDLRGHVLMPGLINTHHHMFQSLTRAIPAAQDAELFDWLQALYPLWANLTPEMIRVSTLTAMAELILSGCTTSSDHLYIYPNGCRLDDAIASAHDIGMRFTASRGSMSVGQSQGGLPPDRVVEREEDILRDTRRLIETYHDANRHSMLHIAVAPCSPFSVSRELMRESAELARSYGVRLHTHLAENVRDVSYSLQKFGMTPAQYAESLGWTGSDVWHAHCVQLDDEGINLFAHSGTGVAHCPCSNMRLASGIAPIPKMRAAGVAVGLGVDGSASNDGAHMLGEARQAMLLARVGFGPAAMSARQALELATLGGAKVLGRDDIGAIAPGMSADCVAFPTDHIGMAGGAVHDAVAALVFCAPSQVTWSVINGRVVVRESVLITVDAATIVQKHNRLARELAEAA
ncbi:MAG: hydroxydechloroatrazine ethylaminohydrolase [Rhodocyclales bacterium]|nr:hydroxydechloroatrazine ethylaminohydrolase [Rhodocyclales bacterium]MDB5888466.1 hydroxydechloroatrazine ethylaminohydrolase [Rhodocyclales bacterium]